MKGGKNENKDKSLRRPSNRPIVHNSLRGLGNKTKEMYHSMLSLKMISLVSFPQASEANMNFNLISKLVYQSVGLFYSDVFPLKMTHYLS